MIEKQTNLFINVMTQHLQRMQSSAMNENYSVAMSEKNNIIDTLNRLKSYMKSMGYVFDFEFSDEINTKEFDRLKKSITNIVENQIIDFVDKIKSGGNISTPEDIQFYTNNKESIEKEMKK